MAKHKFEIRTDHDETEEVWLDGVFIMSTNHDEHGWDGMGVARELTERIAKALGASFTPDVDMVDEA